MTLIDLAVLAVITLAGIVLALQNEGWIARFRAFINRNAGALGRPLFQRDPVIGSLVIERDTPPPVGVHLKNYSVGGRGYLP